MKFLTVFALALAVATCSAFDLRRGAELEQRNTIVPEVELEGRITNGEAAAPGQFPYQAALSCTNGKLSHFCGGSIISPTFILTAAHCTAGVILIEASLGATERTAAEIIYTIREGQIYTHPRYNRITVSNDIALLKMPFTTFTKTIQPIQLPAPSTSYSTYVGDTAVGSGWGRTNDKSGVSESLQFAFFKIISNSDCKKDFRLLITSTKLCSSAPNGVSPCQGDSGGPLVTIPSGVQIGIVSFGSRKGCTQGVSVVYTRVTSYLDWINSTMKK